MWWLILILVFWFITTKPYYWYVKNVPCCLPLPIFGNSVSSLWVGMIDFYDWLYKTFDTPLAGFHLFTRPVLFVKDPGLILEILVKSHDHFASHGLYVNAERDPLGGSVFHLETEKWKNARSKITPQFTPAKVNAMLHLSQISIDKLLKELSKKREVDIKSYTTSYTTDFTTSALFGIETNSFDTTSEFYRLTKETFAPDSSKVLLIGLISSKIFDFLKLTSFSKWAHGFISTLIRDILALENEEASNFVQGIKNLKNEGFDEWFIISQATIMYVGGVETTAASIAFCIYELALNPEVQEKARKEAKGENESACYIDMVISETLRKYPQFALLTRKCTKKFRIPDTSVIIEPGTFVAIPAYSLHNDPRYFEIPNVFDPERFSEENKNKIQPGTYIPWGLGPRTCIGKKLAQQSMKKCISSLLLNYRFSKSANTEIPVKLNPHAFVTTPLDGIWLTVEPLNKNN